MCRNIGERETETETERDTETETDRETETEISISIQTIFGVICAAVCNVGSIKGNA